MQKKESLTVLTHYDILAITQATSIRLRWFLNHFEVKTFFYNSYETLKANSRVFIVKILKYSQGYLLSKVETSDSPVKSILFIYHHIDIQMRWLLMHWKASSMCYNFHVLNKS